MKRLVFAALSLALAGACTSSIPIEELPDESARVSCALIFDCCADGERSGFTTEDECVTMRRLEAVISPELQASLDAGRVVYDGAAAAHCLSIVACDISAAAEACRDVYQPQVQPGGACSHPGDCVDGFCSEGVCIGIPALGEACTNACELGSHCDREAMVCVQSPAIGEPCPDFFCAGGAFCESTSMVCEARRAGGEPCGSSFECESLSCNDDDVCEERGAGDICRP